MPDLAWITPVKMTPSSLDHARGARLLRRGLLDLAPGQVRADGDQSRGTHAGPGGQLPK